MAQWSIKDVHGETVKTFMDGERFEFLSYHFGPRDWSQGLQCQPLDDLGYTTEVVPPPPPSQPSLESVKAAANMSVNDWRMREEEAGFTYDGKPYQSDTRSAQRIQGGLQIAQLQEAANPGSYSQDWKAFDNTMSTLDHAGIVGLMTAMGTHIASVFAQSEAAKAAIGAADDEDAVHAVVANLQSN